MQISVLLFIIYKQNSGLLGDIFTDLKQQFTFFLVLRNYFLQLPNWSGEHSYSSLKNGLSIQYSLFKWVCFLLNISSLCFTLPVSEFKAV